MPAAKSRPAFHGCAVRFAVWALLLIALVAGLQAQDQACHDHLAIKIGGTGETQKHSSDSVAAARDFLWSHWTKGQCAVLTMTAWSIEGVRTDSHCEIQISNNNAIYRATLKRSDGSQSAYEAAYIERVRVVIPYFASKAQVIPDEESLPPSKFRLRFKDKHGKVLTDL